MLRIGVSFTLSERDVWLVSFIAIIFKALRDYNTLQEELTIAERTIVETMDHERMVAARLADRTRRPDREITKDEVNRKLREEQNQLRQFSKELRNNMDEIT